MSPRSSGSIATIQALRAFAVTWVVVDHAFPMLLPGGFVGVDVFFVISGHLITAHLVAELERESFSFGGFYLRRARRLLPAALTVLVFTLLGTFLLLPPAWTADTFSGIGAAAIYAVNWWLAANAVNYFADSGVISPVNHYWSLSVEEQFYLVWPALLWIGWRIFRKAAAASLLRTVAAILAIVFVLSLIAATITTRQDLTTAYFYTHGRAWEFAMGGLSALLARRITSYRPSLKAAWTLSFLLAWAVLFASGWLFSPQSGVPGPIILPVVLATAWALAVGDNHGSAHLHTVITWKPLQRLGDISYSFYLWHWPIMVLAPFALMVETLSTTQRLILLMATLVLSYGSWLFVENRFRVPHAEARSTWASLSYFIAMSIVFAAVAFGLARHQHGKAAAIAQQLYDLSTTPGPCFGGRASEPDADCPDSHRLGNRDYALQNWASQIMTLPNGGVCQSEPGDANLLRCAFGASEANASRRIALLGDSHAGMWAAAIGQFAERAGIRVETFLASSCPTTDDSEVFATYLAPHNRPACLAIRAAATKAILGDPTIDTVVVSGNAYELKRWTGTEWAEDDGAGLARLWERFAAAGKKVVVIDDVPMLPWKLPDCLAQPQSGNQPCTYSQASIAEQTPFARAAALLAHEERITLLSLKDVFCDGVTCHSIIGGIPAYMDADHISAPMARSLAPRLRAVLVPSTSSP